MLAGTPVASIPACGPMTAKLSFCSPNAAVRVWKSVIVNALSFASAAMLRPATGRDMFEPRGYEDGYVAFGLRVEAEPSSGMGAPIPKATRRAKQLSIGLRIFVM